METQKLKKKKEIRKLRTFLCICKALKSRNLRWNEHVSRQRDTKSNREFWCTNILKRDHIQEHDACECVTSRRRCK